MHIDHIIKNAEVIEKLNILPTTGHAWISLLKGNGIIKWHQDQN